MATSPTSSEHKLRFGSFEVDRQTGEARRRGIRVKIKGQPVQILLMLLERPGEVVTRDELRRRLWADDTFVEFEHGLNNAVKKLRQALGDSAEDPVYIETLPRLGYRFVAPVAGQFGEDGAEAVHGPQLVVEKFGARPQATRENAGRILRRAKWVFLAAATALAGFIAYAAFSEPPAPRLLRFEQTTITNSADPFGHLVTDGARVYFLERAGDHWNVVQTSRAGGETRVLPAPFRSTRIFDISRDRTQFLIGSFESRSTALPLWTWPVQGGSPSRVGNITVAEAVWCPDGQNVTYSTMDGELREVRRDGTGDRVLARFPGRVEWLRWSPDGGRLGFAVEDPRTGEQNLWEMNSDGSNTHLRFPGWNSKPRECCGVWTQDGSHFLFSSVKDGIQGIWEVREKASLLHWRLGNPQPVMPGGIRLLDGLVVGEGPQMLAFGTSTVFDLVLDKPREGQNHYSPFLERMEAAASYSKDSDWVTYIRFPERAVWRMKADGSERVRITGPDLMAGSPNWSPDGKMIAFEARTPGKPMRAYAVPADGGDPEEVWPEPGEQSLPRWSTDGKSVVLALNPLAPADFSGPRGIYVVDWATRKPTKVPHSEGLTNPIWSPDGKYLVAKPLDETAILSYDPASEQWTKIVSDISIAVMTWSPDSKYLYYQSPQSPGESVFRLSAGKFERQRVASFEDLLSGGIVRTSFQGIDPSGALVIESVRSIGPIYALDLDLR